MPIPLPLALQTVYAELVERAWLDATERDFSKDGAFVPKTVKGRRYWYWQYTDPDSSKGRRQRYVGAETPELLERIERHRQARSWDKQRRGMVTALLAGGLPKPDALTGRVLEALEVAGAFRLRAVVVGTVAYQTYSGLLGERLGVAAMRTGDLDLAQFPSVSLAVDDHIDAPDLEAVLRSVDPGFQRLPAPPWPNPTDARSTRYGLGQSYRVDILTPNRGPDTGGAAVPLPALRADGQPLRFLDFLIYREVQAVVLHGIGVPVNVPAPERYAIHKMIVSRRRAEVPESQSKARKDLAQAAELIVALGRQRPYELADAWNEAWERGPSWRECLAQAKLLLPGNVQAALTAALDTTRNVSVALTGVNAVANSTAVGTLTSSPHQAGEGSGPEIGKE